MKGHMENITIERSCPVCASRTHRPFADERIEQDKLNDFSYASRKQPEFMCLRLVQCLNCDVIYAPSPPEKEFLSNAYSEAAYDSGPEAKAAAISYAKALKPHLRQITNREAAVDVGAGSGPLLPWLSEQGFHPVMGIEPSRAAIEAAPPNVQAMLREGMFSQELLAGIRPSLICSFMTLEHISDPSELANTAFEVLEKNGMLAVVVHNWRAPLNRALGLRSPIIDVEHLQLFSEKSLRVLLSKAGFENIKVNTISNSYPLRYWLRLTPLPQRLKKTITRALEFIKIADLKIPIRVGNMIAVGVKIKEQK